MNVRNIGQRLLVVFALSLIGSIAVFAQNGPDSDPDGARGYVDNVFHHSQVDSINLYNGQLTIPLAIGPSYPIGPKLKFQTMLVYTSTVWEYGNPGPNNQSDLGLWQPIKADPALGIGWSLTLGAIKTCGVVQNSVCYVSPDGAEHLFDMTVQSGYLKTSDASQLLLHNLGASGYEMWDGDGNHYIFDWQVTGYDDLPQNYTNDLGRGRNGWYLRSLADSFGNGISASYYQDLGSQTPCWTSNCPTPSKSWIVNTVSRNSDSKALLTVTLATEVGVSNMVKYLDVPVFANGAAATARWTLSHSAVNVTRGLPNQASLNLPTISSIALPVAAQFSFSYNSGSSDNSWGGLVQTMTLPTNGVISYVWGTYSFYHGRTASISINCQPLGPPSNADVRQSGRAGDGQLTNGPSSLNPNIAGTDCTPSNYDRWRDTMIGVLRRTETLSGQNASTDYAQFAFPFSERGASPTDPNNTGPQTITLVTLPPNVDGNRFATATLFWGARKGSNGSGTPGDRIGADLRVATYDHDPYPGLLVPFGQPLCGGNADALCVSHSSRVVSRTYEYDAPSGEVGNRRLQSQTTYYSATQADGSCPGCRYHAFSYSNTGANTWEGNGRHYNTESHAGNLGTDGRTITTTWSPSNWTSVPPTNGFSLPNLFTRRTEVDLTLAGPINLTDTRNTLDRFYYFDSTSGFLNGSATWDSLTKRVAATCRYGDGFGNASDELTVTAVGYTSDTQLASIPCYAHLADWPNGYIGLNNDLFGRESSYASGQPLSRSWLRDKTALGWQFYRVDRDLYPFINPASDTGWVRSSYDTAGQRTDYIYDAVGRIASVAPPGEAAATVSYDSTTQTTVSRSGGDGNSTWQRLLYDGLGRLVREIRQMPGSAYSVRSHSFDAPGHEYSLSEWLGCSSILPPSGDCLTASPAGTTQSSFDPFGRPQQIKGADGATTLISYADAGVTNSDTGKTVTVQNIGGTCSGGTCSGGTSAGTFYKYDAFGRLTSVTEPAAPSSDVTSYSYDVAGKVVTVAQGTQNRYFTFDSLGFPLTETTPEAGMVDYRTTVGSFTFSNIGSLGNVVGKKAGTGAVTFSFGYDPAGRLSSEIAGGGTYLTNCYDGNTTSPCSSTGGSNPFGRLTQRIGQNPGTPSTVTESFTYSGLGGRLSQKDISLTGTPLGTLTFSEAWSYNSLGLVATHTHPKLASDGDVTASTTYSNGLPTGMTSGAQTLASSVSYNQAGALSAWTSGNGVTTTIAQDGVMPRPLSISASTGWNTGNYLYDGAGNIKTIGSDSFGYDLRSRLTSASLPGAGNQYFCYDRFGNRTVLSTGPSDCSFAPVWTDNRQPGLGYDSQGNVTANGSQSYLYDALSRRTSAGTERYLYDGSGERIARVADGSGFFTITPCRFLDTRNSPGTPLDPSTPLNLQITGAMPCGSGSLVPSGATAISGNLAAVAPSGGGFLALSSGDTGASTSTLNFNAGRTRANNVTLGLSATGQLKLASSTSTHTLLDLNGYFQPSVSAETWYLTLRDESDRLSAEYTVTSSGATRTKDYFHFGSLLASTRDGAGSYSYYASDHLGTPRIATGAVSESHRYYPFGEEVTSTFGNQPLKFAVMERDISSGHDYDHARFHNAPGGRFLSPDAVGGDPEDPQSWNRYAYAKNNPLLYVDPNGQEPLTHTAAQQLHAAATAVRDYGNAIVTPQFFGSGYTRGDVVTNAVSGLIGFVGDVLDIGSSAEEVVSGSPEAGHAIARDVAAAIGAFTILRGIATSALGEASGIEPYDRRLHYGNTPTRGDRAALGADSGEVVNHEPPLVKRYYEGDPTRGEKPGSAMSGDERRASASDRSRMNRQSKRDSCAQGADCSRYAREKRTELENRR